MTGLDFVIAFRVDEKSHMYVGDRIIEKEYNRSRRSGEPPRRRAV